MKKNCVRIHGKTLDLVPSTVLFLTIKSHFLQRHLNLLGSVELCAFAQKLNLADNVINTYTYVRVCVYMHAMFLYKLEISFLKPSYVEIVTSLI